MAVTSSPIGRVDGIQKNPIVDELVGRIPHQLDATIDSLLFSPCFKSTTTHTQLITQHAVLELNAVVSNTSSSLPDDVATDLSRPQQRHSIIEIRQYENASRAPSIQTTPLGPSNEESKYMIQIMPLSTQGWRAGAPVYLTTSTPTTGTATTWPPPLSVAANLYIIPSASSTRISERVEVIRNATRSAKPGTTILAAPVTSRGSPRIRPKIALAASFVMLTAHVFLGRNRRPDPALQPGYTGRGGSKHDVPSKQKRKPRQAGWEDRTLVVHGLDDNESVLASVERNTPVSDAKRQEVYVLLRPYGAIVQMTFLDQDRCVVEWEERDDAIAMMGYRRKPRYRDREIGTVWYGEWETFLREREAEATVRINTAAGGSERQRVRVRVPDDTRRPGSERRQREKAAAILRRAQAALKTIIVQYESAEATDLLDEVEEALDRAFEEDKDREAAAEAKKREQRLQAEASRSAGGRGGGSWVIPFSGGISSTAGEGSSAARVDPFSIPRSSGTDPKGKGKAREMDIDFLLAPQGSTITQAQRLLARAQQALKSDAAVDLLARAQRSLREETRGSRVTKAANLLAEARETLLREGGGHGRGIAIPDAEPVEGEGKGEGEGEGETGERNMPSSRSSSPTGSRKSSSSWSKELEERMERMRLGGRHSSDEDDDEMERRGRTRERMFERYEIALLSS
ncbi:hypothetical protein SLS62_008422 [Diatrype stigma]|uniref:Uncharacterized protein n=1 Tax=Diatrype stigma TaxID=117547 RepID=A0AAN9YP05_9PEZI